MRHLLVIGAQRSGTTYLLSALEAHPQIVTARPGRPEPKVFMSDDLAGRGAQWYRDTYFSHRQGEPVLVEKSTSYIEDASAPARVRSVLGAATIVVMLRDPVDRAVSNWRFSTDNGLESRPLAVALAENLEASRPWDPRTTSVSPYAYVERGRFTDYLGPWLARFPDTTHLVLMDDLVGADSALEGVYEAAGVDPGFRPGTYGRPVNQSEEPAPALPAELTARLRDYYLDSDAALRDLLGRDLPWRAAS